MWTEEGEWVELHNAAEFWGDVRRVSETSKVETPGDTPRHLPVMRALTKTEKPQPAAGEMK